MSISYFQSGAMTPLDGMNFSRPRQQHRPKGRSLNISEVKLHELKTNIKSARPPFINKVTNDILRYTVTDRQHVTGLDMAWVFIRNTPMKLLHVDVEQLVPGWSGFHSTVTSKLSVPTQIGYATFIPYSVKDPNTVYTCLRSLNESFKIHLRQTNPVVTFDEDLYATAKQIQWAVSPESDNMVIRLGGFHMAKNFIGVIGKRMEESGIEDLWTESGLYGSAIARKIINGTHYYRARNAHELTFEAMSLKFYESFCSWFENQPEFNEQLITDIKQRKNSPMKLFSVQETDEIAVRNAISELLDVLEKLEPFIEKFIHEGSENSDTFAYWTEYLEMVKLLLTFVFADRQADWKVHLSCFSEMLRYNRGFDHNKYFRWGLVYLIDMSMLSETAPDIYNPLANHSGLFVSRSKVVSKFNMVSPDMALEQSQNKDSKIKGGLSGIANKLETRER